MGQPLITIILDDWSVRDSFHLTYYLNQQTLPRHLYEIIWVEYYQRWPHELVARWNAGEFEQWLQLNRTGEFHHGVCQNAALSVSRGRLIVVPDSDSVASPTFLSSVYQHFFNRLGKPLYRRRKDLLLFHQHRLLDHGFYPFTYPSFDTLRKNSSYHKPNYGACLVTWKEHLMAVAGFNEDDVMRGIACPWTEMVARLNNYGLKEVWHPHEILYHTWHPMSGTTTSRPSRAWIRKVKSAGIVQAKSSRFLF